MALTVDGTDRLLELIGDVSGHDSLATFRIALLEAVRRAVPARYVSYNEVGEAHAVAFSRPALPADAAQRWLSVAAEHPVLDHMRRTRDGRPARISDHLPLPAFKATRLYREFYAPVGVCSQVAFALPAAPPLLIGIALSRGQEDFSDEEVELLARARPHLIQAYRTTQAAELRERLLDALQRGLDADGLAVAADRDGRVHWAGSQARAAIGLPPDPDAAARLPEPLRAEIAAHRAAPGGALRTADGNALRLLPAVGDDDLDVLLVDPPDGGLTVSALRALGLTPREAEALRWLALGHTGPDAARAMGVAPRTVAKHLQAVYAKLGVGSRSEAAATAWAAVGGPTPDRRTHS